MCVCVCVCSECVCVSLRQTRGQAPCVLGHRSCQPVSECFFVVFFFSTSPSVKLCPSTDRLRYRQEPWHWHTHRAVPHGFVPLSNSSLYTCVSKLTYKCIHASKQTHIPAAQRYGCGIKNLKQPPSRQPMLWLLVPSSAWNYLEN